MLSISNLKLQSLISKLNTRSKGENLVPDHLDML